MSNLNTRAFNQLLAHVLDTDLDCEDTGVNRHGLFPQGGPLPGGTVKAVTTQKGWKGRCCGSTEKADLVQPAGGVKRKSGKPPGEGDIKPVLKEMRELRRGASGGKRPSRQEQHKQRHEGRSSMVCMRPES